MPQVENLRILDHVYKGEVDEKGQKEGYGQYTVIDGLGKGQQYEGYFSNGDKSGSGKFFWPSGSSFEGQWAEDKRNGFGKFYFANGDRHEGQYVDDKCNGQGKYFYADGTIFEGNYVNNKREGYGKIIRPNGDWHEGQYKNDRCNGYGIHHFLNGTRLEGIYKDDTVVGPGRFFWPNGDVYEGNFNDNKMSGKGTLFHHNGIIFDGHYKDGRRDGFGLQTSPDGEKLLLKYNMGTELTRTIGSKEVARFEKDYGGRVKAEHFASNQLTLGFPQDPTVRSTARRSISNASNSSGDRARVYENTPQQYSARSSYTELFTGPPPSSVSQLSESELQLNSGPLYVSRPLPAAPPRRASSTQVTTQPISTAARQTSNTSSTASAPSFAPSSSISHPASHVSSHPTSHITARPTNSSSAPQGPAAHWTARQVAQWANDLPLPPPVIAALEGIPGEILIQLTDPELQADLPISKLHKVVLTAAIKKLS